MKTLNIPLEDKEFEILKEAKKKRTWHDFIMSKARANIRDIEIEEVIEELDNKIPTKSLDDTMQTIKELDPEFPTHGLSRKELMTHATKLKNKKREK